MASDQQKNCWEYLSCGPEPGGLNASRAGVCPAATATVLDGVHGGRNAGRSCWVIAGTFAAKYRNCSTCNFFQAVRAEELALVPTYILMSLNEKSQPSACAGEGRDASDQEKA